MPLDVDLFHVSPDIRLRRDVQHLAEAPVPRPRRRDDHPTHPAAGDEAGLGTSQGADRPENRSAYRQRQQTG